MNLQKPAKPIRDRKHLAFLHKLPCCITGWTYGIVAHHLLRTPEKAMGRKSGDDKAIPLHHDVHVALHCDGDEVAFLARHGILHGPALAKALYAVSGDIEQAGAILRGLRQEAS